MIDHQETWQVFAENGELISGRGMSAAELEKNPSLITGNAHVWMWRFSGGKVEILLQKRSQHKKNHPGKWSVSAAGHIDVGETVLIAAVRESREELDLVIEPANLFFIRTARGFKDECSFKTVYTYQLNGDEKIVFADGEVEATKWYDLDEFDTMTQDPDRYNLVNHGSDYFATLSESLRR